MLNHSSKLIKIGGNYANETKRFYDSLPPKFRYLMVVLIAIMSMIIIWLFIKWAFLDKPNDYAWHLDKADKALEADFAVTEFLHQQKDAEGRNIVQQIRENPNGVINGVQLKESDHNNNNKAVDAVKKSINEVERNKKVVADAGGLATLEQVQQSYNGKPLDPYTALKIQRTLEDAGVKTGANINPGVTDAQLGASAYTAY